MLAAIGNVPWPNHHIDFKTRSPAMGKHILKQYAHDQIERGALGSGQALGSQALGSQGIRGIRVKALGSGLQGIRVRSIFEANAFDAKLSTLFTIICFCFSNNFTNSCGFSNCLRRQSHARPEALPHRENSERSDDTARRRD